MQIILKMSSRVTETKPSSLHLLQSAFGVSNCDLYEAQ